MNSSAPRKRRIYFDAIGSHFRIVSISSDDSKRPPPSVGWLPLAISGVLSDKGVRRLSIKIVGASTRYGLISSASISIGSPPISSYSMNINALAILRILQHRSP